MTESRKTDSHPLCVSMRLPLLVQFELAYARVKIVVSIIDTVETAGYENLEIVAFCRGIEDDRHCLGIPARLNRICKLALAGPVLIIIAREEFNVAWAIAAAAAEAEGQGGDGCRFIEADHDVKNAIGISYIGP